MSKPSGAVPALLLIAGVFINPVAADPADPWFELLIDKMCELTAEKGKVAEVGSEAVDVVLREGYATELTTYAMSVGDKGFGEAMRMVCWRPAQTCIHKKDPDVCRALGDVRSWVSR